MNAIAESYLQGISTRRVQEVVSALGVENMSASRVSRIAQELDEAVQEFLSKPIECEIPHLFVDASYFKVRDGTRYETKALFVVAGVRDDGYREIQADSLVKKEIKIDGYHFSTYGGLHVYVILQRQSFVSAQFSNTTARGA